MNYSARVRFLLVFAALAAGGCEGLPAIGNVALNLRNRAFWERLTALTVRVRVPDAQGSGVLIPGGRVLTAGHLIDEFTSATVFLTELAPDGTFRDGDRYFAEVLRTDEKHDLALLRLLDAPSKLPAATLGDSRHLRVGETLYRLGRTDDVWMTSGRIINLSALIHGQTLIEIALIGGVGSSGGPVFSGRGELMGIVVIAGCDARGGFSCRYPDYAVPINDAYAKLLHR